VRGQLPAEPRSLGGSISWLEPCQWDVLAANVLDLCNRTRWRVKHRPNLASS